VFVQHSEGRSVADTDAMCAVTGRSDVARAVQIRRYCPRDENGRYEVELALEAIAASPEPVVYPGSRLAGRAVGVAAATVRAWVGRKRIRTYGEDASGRPLFCLDELQLLAGDQ
jgi:hypothetical protein